MDIQEAFDSTTFAATQDALARRNMGKTMISWIVNTLSCRSVHWTYQGNSAEAKVVKGCPQGEVLFPLLGCMVVDSLLQQLNAEGYLKQGYAVDPAMMVTRKHLSTAGELTRRGLRKIDTWCKTEGLTEPWENRSCTFYKKEENQWSRKTWISRSEIDPDKGSWILWRHPWWQTM